MKDYIELPINKKIHSSNIYAAGLLSIITSEEYCGTLNAQLSKLSMIEDNIRHDYFIDAEFNQNLKNITLDSDNKNHTLQFHSSPYIENKYAFLYKEIIISKHSQSSVEVKIEYIQDSHAWSYIKLLITDGVRRYDTGKHEACFSDEASIVLTSHGKMFFHYKSIYKRKQLECQDGRITLYLRIDVGKTIHAKYSFDGVQWYTIWKTKCKMQNLKKAGIYINPRVNPFFYEYYVTQLQLCYNSAAKLIMPQTQIDVDNFTNILDVYHVSRETIPLNNNKLIEYYMDLLSKRYYICLQLDEYYVSEREAYQNRHIMHRNYIFGFNRKKRVFKLMGFDNSMIFSEIGFDEFIKADCYQEEVTNNIMIYKYNSKKQPDRFPKETVIKILKSYLEGKNCYALTWQKIVIDSEPSFVYGIKIFDLMICSAADRQSFIKDIRLSDQICEHYLNVIRIIELITGSGYVSEDVCIGHYSRFQALVEISSLLKTILIKKAADIDEKVRELLIELKKRDVEATEKVIELMENIK